MTIDKSSQEMSVTVDGHTRYTWPVSTGRSGYNTPSGRFRPEWLARKHFSKKYYDSPMPHSIFFHHGFAIHGTEYIRRLGRPASHGCIRLHPRHAATLFALVREAGMRNTRIVISGAIASTRHGRRKTSRIKSKRQSQHRADVRRSRERASATKIWRY